MSSEIRQRQTVAAIPAEPSDAPAMTATSEAPQSPARQFRSRLWRTLFMLLLAVSAYFGYQQGWLGGKEKPKIIYASRYSDEYKYRPAASPVITETLADGRIRLRGASPAGVGIDPNSLPKTPQQLAKERQAAQEEALENAKRQLGIKTRKKKEKSNLEMLMAQGIPMAGRGDAGVGGGGAGQGGLRRQQQGSGQGQPMGGQGMRGTAMRGGRKGLKVQPGMDGRPL